MDKPIRFGDRRIFLPFSSFDFISRSWMKCESEAWTSSITIQYVNGSLTQILICLMATSKCIQLVAMNGGADSLPLTRWAVWATASHNGYQNLPSCPFYVRLWIRHQLNLLKLFETHSQTVQAVFQEKHLIQLTPTIWFNQQMCENCTFSCTTACHSKRKCLHVF